LKKALLVFLSILAVVAIAVVGCAKPAAAPKEEGTPAATTPPKEGAVECKFSVAGPMWLDAAEGFGLNAYMAMFQALVEKHPKFKDKFVLKIYDKAQLYNMNDAQTALASGAIHMTYGGPHYFEQWNPAWALLEAPGIIDNYEHFMRVLETDPFQALTHELAGKGTTILTWMGNVGDVYLFTSKPINSLSDLKGIKMRYFGGEGQAKALAALGMEPVFLPYTEVVTALQTKQIEGVVTDLSGALFFFELPRYTPYLLPYVISVQPVCMTANTKWLDSVPESGQLTDPGMRELLTHPVWGYFNRMDTWPYYERQGAIMMQFWKASAKMSPYNEGDAKKLKQVVVDAQKSIFDKLDPKYMKAIDSVR